MRLFISILAIILAALTQIDSLNQYMRGILRAASNLSRPIRNNSSHFNTMANSKQWVGYPVIPPEDPSLNAANPTPRGISQVFEAREQAEGAGATVRRSIGTPKLRNFTPFLMLDHFKVDVGAGFPDHPHRGQETITYLLSGGVDHEDFTGQKGTLFAGDLQFMTAGRGIVHAEMPHDGGSSAIGVQLWIDLPADLKSCEPRYRDLRASEIPVATTDDGKVTIKVISGRSQNVDSLQELAYTPVWILDVTISPGGRLVQPLPAKWNTFAYTLEGTTVWDTGSTTKEVPRYHNTVFEQNGDQVIAYVPSSAKEDSRFVLISGMPLDQPVLQYGPFVGLNAAQVRQAVMDYSTYSNGFERAENWQSEIGRSMI